MFPGMNKTFEEWTYMEHGKRAWRLSKSVGQPWILKHGEIVHASGTLPYLLKSLIGVQDSDMIRIAIFTQIVNQVADQTEMNVVTMKVEPK